MQSGKPLKTFCEVDLDSLVPQFSLEVDDEGRPLVCECFQPRLDIRQIYLGEIPYSSSIFRSPLSPLRNACRASQPMAKTSFRRCKKTLILILNDIDTILPGTLCSFIRPTEELFLCERLPCVTRRPPRIVAVIRAGLSGDQSEQS